MTFEEYRQKAIDEIKDCIKEMQENGYTQEEIDEWVAQQEVPSYFKYGH